MAAALSDDIIHLPSTHFQTRWLVIVGSLLEDKERWVRLLEGPFVVLTQIRPLQSGYNIVMNVVCYIKILTSQLDLANRFRGGSETCLCRCLPSTGWIGVIPIGLGDKESQVFSCMLCTWTVLEIMNSSGEYEWFCRTLTVAAVCHYLKDSLHCVRITV